MQRPNAHRRGYDARWRKARLLFLADNPLCKMCEADGLVEAATVVDHIVPHRGDKELFWDVANWQGLCTTHHSSFKQRMEKNGVRAIGLDGWPVEDA